MPPSLTIRPASLEDGGLARGKQNPSRVDNVDNIARTLLAAVPLDKTMHLMDFGSGTGLLLERVAPQVGKITAVDISESMNRELRDKAGRLGDGCRLPGSCRPVGERGPQAPGGFSGLPAGESGEAGFRTGHRRRRLRLPLPMDTPLAKGKTGMQPTVRVARATDAEELATLVNRAYRPSPDQRGWTRESGLVSGERTCAEQIRRLFGPDSAVLVLERDGTLLACVHVAGGDFQAYIGMLATDPACQAAGLGKQLLRQAEEYAVAHFGAVEFRISVLSSRPELLAFYERRGYRQTGEIEDYPRDAGVGTPLVDGLRVLSLSKKTAPLSPQQPAQANG